MDWAIVASPPNISIVTLLLDHFHDKKSLPAKSLVIAAAHSNRNMIQLLLNFGFTQQESCGVTPLTQALWCQRSSVIIQLLLDHGADVNKID